MTPLGEQILRKLRVQGCEILIEGAVLKTNLTSFEMFEFDVILNMDQLSTHHASVNCFTKKVVFQKSGHPELEFENDNKVLHTCDLDIRGKKITTEGV